MNKTAFFLCDLQEKFKPAIQQFPLLINVAQRMIKASDILSIPIIGTEQNPLKLGKFDPELKFPSSINERNESQFKDILTHSKVHSFSKMKFSMCIPSVLSLLKEYNIEQVALFGIEAHVCILQTALDLLSQNIKTYLIVDGISSRHFLEKKIALSRLEKEGAILTTSESFLFHLLVDANHEKFRDISKLVIQTDPSIWNIIENKESHQSTF